MSYTRRITALICIAFGSVRAQEQGSVELGVFGAPKAMTPQASMMSAGRVTVFLTNRVALETQQNLTGLSRLNPLQGGGIWTVLALPFTRQLRVHAGPGLLFTDGAEGRSSPRPVPNILLGGRLGVYDWLGVRVDAQIALPGALMGGAHGAAERRREVSGVFGGFSFRIR